MDQPVLAKPQSAALAAASVYRLLLADEIAVALTSGASVAATGTRDTDDILDLTANALIETGARVLQFRPPLDGPSFISQFAAQWRMTGKRLQDLLPQASGERFVMLIHQAHSMAPETLHHLDRMARAWPGMQMAFAGLPTLARLLESEGLPEIKRRVTVFTKIAVAEEAPRQTDEQVSAPVPIHPTEQPRAASFTPTFTIPSGELALPGYNPLKGRPKQSRKRGQIVALAVAIAAFGVAATVATVPQMQEWAGTARIYVANLLPDTPTRTRRGAPPPNHAVIDQAAIEPATPSEPAPPPLWTAPSPDEPPPPAQATQLTLLGNEQSSLPATNTSPGPPPQPREASEPPPEAHPAPAPTPTRTINPAASANAEPPPNPAAPVPSLPPASTAALPSISSELAEAMTKRGRAMLEWGDVSAARLLLTRATSAGSGEAALLMGTTFDAATLDRIGAVGIPPDPIQAAAWYRVALALGEQRARAMLEDEPTTIANVKPKDSP